MKIDRRTGMPIAPMDMRTDAIRAQDALRPTDRMLDALLRIADALDRAYPPQLKPTHPPVGLLFDDPKVDPVAFVMDMFGETRADAEAIVATTLPQEDSDHQLSPHTLAWLKN